MKCHYEVLSVEHDASASDIKKGYFKAARVWHPDKNAHRAEEATAEFQLIQAAYAVLSDPQERAWYDDHREAILRGGSGADDDGPKDGMNVMAYFSGSVFRGFGDDPGGFYASYGEIFQDLFEDRASVFEDPDVVFRPFGNSNSSEEEVTNFYQFWFGYTTTYAFASGDKWDIREAPDRRIRRLMEKENKKLRDGQ